ncbi:hypothetical protein ACFY2R_24490 [Micromonospora olivasterospora]|uniref:Uncharacterized protein n=1 Tax=Micromonospora olivasterospora TaxID=1880 RepID=A0A562I7F5_MICOL|nr:hypothetical protein [Micromonospora olivasterospora]TWH66950.1 hypothetical protein JD77_01911 [Micromonospora olivasterospora]
MRLTVGPLPPAVYWRRRVVVLGAGLLFLIVLLYSCSRTGNGGTTPQAQTTPTTAVTPDAGQSASPDPSASVLAPQTGAPPAGGADGSGEPSSGPGENAAPAVPAADGSTCTDVEISVTPVPLPARAQRGTVVGLQLKIKNRSDRTCSRDVGADMQELYIKSGAEKVWSSDTCGNAKGSDVQSFTPSFERSYQVDWNGKYSSKCANGVASGDFVPAGTYQVFGRVDTKLSEPVKLTITN